MKRIIYLATLLTLAACSSDEVVDVNQNDSQYITYDIITNSATRALDTHTASSKVPFKVSAIYTPAEGSTSAPNFYFKNDEMTVSGSTYTYTYGRRIWPDATSSLDFYAWHDDNDYDNSNSSAYPGVTKYTGPTISYVSGDDDNTFNNQVAMSITGYNSSPTNNSDDILYAVSTGRTKGDDGVVPINFRHALSQINFTIANAENSNLLVEIANISLCGIHMQGDFYCGTSTTNQYLETDTIVQEQAKDIWDDPKYDVDGNPVMEDKTVTLNYNHSNACYWKTTDENNNEISSNNGVYSTDEYWKADGNAKIYLPGTTSDASDFISNLMLIPQTFSAGDFNYDEKKWDGVYLKISCCIFSLVNSTCLDDFRGNASENLIFVLAEALAGLNINDTSKNHEIWGVPIFAGDSYDSGEGFNLYRYVDLYIPLPALLDNSQNNVGWQAGIKYNYTINFGSEGRYAIDEEGNPVVVQMSLTTSSDDIGTVTYKSVSVE